MKKQVFFLAVILTAVSCSTSNKYMASPMQGGSQYEIKKESQQTRMMIYNAAVTLESNQPDSISRQILIIAQQFNGYILNSTNSHTTIRVESSYLNEVLDNITSLGKVKNRNINGTDVTDEYTDYAIRLDNAKRTRDRYLQLLQKANTVDETLKVEKELERLNRDIDLLEGKINSMNHLTSYATITISYAEGTKPGVLGYLFVGLYKGVKWLFVR